MAYIFALPSLRTVRLSNIKCAHDPESDIPVHHWPLPLESSGVHTLLLHDVCVPSDFISCILKSCKALRHFHYEIELVSNPWNLDNLDAIFGAHEPQRASLEVLSLQNTADYFEEHDVRVPLGGFEEPCALKSLSAPFTLLMGKPDEHNWQYPECETSYFLGSNT